MNKKFNYQVEVIENKRIAYGNGYDNLLIEGENMFSLDYLKNEYSNKVNVIYIDPPYNTGNQHFIYNDNFKNNHSEWTSYMSERLKLSYQLLSMEGIILISINDKELYHLKILLDEVFGEKNFISNIIWVCKSSTNDVKFLDNVCEYILVYAKDKTKCTFNREDSDLSNKKYKLSDEFSHRRGNYLLNSLNRSSIRYSPNLDYPIEMPDGTILYPSLNNSSDGRSTWRWSQDKLKWGIENHFIVYKKNRYDQWRVYFKQYQYVNNKDEFIKRSMPYRNIINDIKTSQSDRELKQLFGKKIFTYPKPLQLIVNLLKMTTNKNSIVLDFFAGSGTTGHAVLELNKEDLGNRKFILCTNNENNICDNITYPRLFKVINGYTNNKGKKINGIHSNLRYIKIDEI